MILTRLRVLVATLWAGSLWTVGYLVAPTLSATMTDRKLFGSVAGSIFRSEAWLTVACALAMLVLVALAGELEPKRRKTLNWLVTGMLACTLVGYFALQPMMASLREAAGPLGVMESANVSQKSLFGILHGVSALFFLVQSILGVALVIKNTDTTAVQ